MRVVSGLAVNRSFGRLAAEPLRISRPAEKDVLAREDVQRKAPEPAEHGERAMRKRQGVMSQNLEAVSAQRRNELRDQHEVHVRILVLPLSSCHPAPQVPIVLAVCERQDQVSGRTDLLPEETEEVAGVGDVLQYAGADNRIEPRRAEASRRLVQVDGFEMIGIPLIGKVLWRQVRSTPKYSISAGKSDRNVHLAQPSSCSVAGVLGG
jgi:hypothetical protein